MTVLDQINSLPRLTQWGTEYVSLEDVRRIVQQPQEPQGPDWVERGYAEIEQAFAEAATKPTEDRPPKKVANDKTRMAGRRSGKATQPAADESTE